ncbi:UNVERIFIED_CONTAM: hypothetical protein GTU68_014494 [Idotea baltica]|nr:hypothetical protein [Idotea baltica]
MLFPTITIGLCWILLFFRVRFTQTGDVEWEYAYYFWVKIFALTFALGVVSGITMSFQFGTNWPGFMEKAGNIAGPLLGYEVLTAFFLEASFLAIMLFAGYTVIDGVIHIESWIEIIFNPSFPYRFAHMLIASLLTASFLVAGISAWRARKKVDGPATWKVIRTGVFLAAVLTPIQIFVGDLHGLNTLEYQPAKVAAMEGIWHTERGAPLTLFGIPDEEEQTTHYALKIPKLASLILTHEMDGEVKGISEFDGVHPPVAPVFWSFRVMVGVGVLMLLISWFCAFKILRQKTLNAFPLRLLSWMTFSGWIAMLAGWYVTEVGRQPWIVSGLLKTSDVVADHSGGTVLTTLIAYALLYVGLLVSYILTLRYMSTKKARSLMALQDKEAIQQLEGGAY